LFASYEKNSDYPFRPYLYCPVGHFLLNHQQLRRLWEYSQIPERGKILTLSVSISKATFLTQKNDEW
jgi:hypothetical protein